MKNTALIFNAVLLVLIGVLFYLHFSSKKQTSPKVESVQTRQFDSSNNKFRIGYFEWDSVANRFELFKAFQNEINQREENNERKKVSLRQQYQDRYNSYSRKQMSQTESEI